MTPSEDLSNIDVVVGILHVHGHIVDYFMDHAQEKGDLKNTQPLLGRSNLFWAGLINELKRGLFDILFKECPTMVRRQMLIPKFVFIYFSKKTF